MWHLGPHRGGERRGQEPDVPGPNNQDPLPLPCVGGGMRRCQPLPPAPPGHRPVVDRMCTGTRLDARTSPSPPARPAMHDAEPPCDPRDVASPAPQRGIPPTAHGFPGHTGGVDSRPGSTSSPERLHPTRTLVTRSGSGSRSCPGRSRPLPFNSSTSVPQIPGTADVDHDPDRPTRPR